MHDQNFLYHIQISQPTDTLAKSRVIIKLKAKLETIQNQSAVGCRWSVPRPTVYACALP